ncbi:MAG: flagellar hook capping protein [Desulfobacterium sp.]|nr:flagellar hook capping protein [Desulfobacterium sp.]MBU3949180.1 flagellar hook capping protein [Pseudomonadota bacterium]MBU4037409.1 flagellar hook capping protein [Pseudomonadota bacterium]
MIIGSTGYYNQLSGIGEDSLESTKAKKEMGKDEFLSLLVTQLKYQDPLNPMQSQEFSAQLAQFSSLEQLTNMNSTLSGIQGSITDNKQDNLLDYIGKNVKMSDDKTGEVTGVTYKNGVGYLMVGENRVLPDNVVEITLKQS